MSMEHSTGLSGNFWMSFNNIRDGIIAPRNITDHILRISFDKSIAKSISHFRILLVASEVPEISLIGYPTKNMGTDRSKEAGFPELTLLFYLHNGSTYLADAVQKPLIEGGKPILLFESALAGTNNFLVPLRLYTTSFRRGQMKTNYYVHVAACDRTSSPFPPDMESSIIRRIFQFCVNPGMEIHFRGKRISQLSRISKLWQSVSTEFFGALFSDLTKKQYFYTTSLPMLVSMLRQKPSRGLGLAVLPRISYPNGGLRSDGGRGEEIWTSNIRSLYPHLPDLTRVDTMSPLLIKAREELSVLRKVKSLQVYAPYPSAYSYWGSSGEEDLIGATLQVANGWENLEEMELAGNELFPGGGLHEVPDEDSQYSLSQLSLSQLFIGSSRISHMLPKGNSRLTRLSFDRVKGLSRSDYRMIFESAASTIRDIDIRRCEVKPDTEMDFHTEAPLDSAIARMVNIRSITIRSELASNLSIARKAPRSDNIQTKINITRYELVDLDATKDRARLGIEESLKQTGWSSITICLGSTKGVKVTKAMNRMKQEHLKAAREIAQSRGIKFLTP